MPKFENIEDQNKYEELQEKLEHKKYGPNINKNKDINVQNVNRVKSNNNVNDKKNNIKK